MLKRFALIGSLLFPYTVYSQNFHGNVAFMGAHTPFEDLTKNLVERYTEGKMTYQVLPFKRSLKGVVDGKADFHIPIIHSMTKSEEDLGFTFSTASIGKVIFGLYVNKNNKKININNFTNGEFVIETDAAHSNFYNFKNFSSSCPKCSLQKVNSGRIDGYLYAVLLAENIINENNKELINLDSLYYKTYDIKIVIPPGKKGKKIDAILTKYVTDMKRDGVFDKLFNEINKFNSNWKPTRSDPK